MINRSEIKPKNGCMVALNHFLYDVSGWLYAAAVFFAVKWWSGLIGGKFHAGTSETIGSRSSMVYAQKEALRCVM